MQCVCILLLLAGCGVSEDVCRTWRRRAWQWGEHKVKVAVKAYQSVAFVIRKEWAASLHHVSDHPCVLIVIPILPALLSPKSWDDAYLPDVLPCPCQWKVGDLGVSGQLDTHVCVCGGRGLFPGTQGIQGM